MKNIILYVAAVFLAPLGASADMSPEPVLDITLTSSGEIKDSSGFERDIRLRNDQIGVKEDKKFIELTGSNAITIPYQANDPLFGNGEFTWIIKCKFQNTAGVNGSDIVFGRWDVGREDAMRNGRVAALNIDSGNGGLLFMLSPDGTAEGTVGLLSQPPPDDRSTSGWARTAMTIHSSHIISENVNGWSMDCGNWPRSFRNCVTRWNTNLRSPARIPFKQGRVTHCLWPWKPSCPMSAFASMSDIL